MDLKEQGENLILHAELPGCKKEDISIELNNGILTVSGEKKEEKKEENDKYHRIERTFGRFSRSMAVPKEVTEDKIKASYDNGVLEVTIPKPGEIKPQPKKIIIG